MTERTDLGFTPDALAELAGRVGEIHRYALDLARKIGVGSPLAAQAMMRDALGRLQERGLVRADERPALDRLADAMTGNIDDAEEALRKAGEYKSLVAVMLWAIARDSISHERAHPTPGQENAQLPPGAHARQTGKAIMAWVGDVAAGAAGAVSGIAATPVGSFFVGSIAAAAASSFILS